MKIELSRNRYIFIYGVLFWGGFVTLFGFAFYVYRHRTASAADLTLEFVLRALVFGLGGYAWGATMWSWMERNKKKHGEQN